MAYLWAVADAPTGTNSSGSQLASKNCAAMRQVSTAVTVQNRFDTATAEIFDMNASKHRFSCVQRNFGAATCKVPQ